MHRNTTLALLGLGAAVALIAGCGKKEEAPPPPPAEEPVATAPVVDASKFLTQPLVSEIYTADPSAHVFNGKVYIYPSHDIDSGIPSDDLGTQYDMKDYQVLSLDSLPDGQVTVHPVGLTIADVPWASKQMWAPDAAEKGGKYFLYFPVKDKEGVFRIGAAVGDAPEGPFKAQPEAIKNSFSMDPNVFKDDDGKYYMYFGGIWGGQLQKWKSGKYDAADDAQPADGTPAMQPKIARMADDMVEFAEKPKDVKIVDDAGKLINSEDHKRRFFEAAWVFKRNGTYYLTYSNGDEHQIVYATGKSPYGPFTFKGVILQPVLGWTNHHSIVEFQGKWWLFYHDAQISGGTNHLRNVKKPIEVTFAEDGSINTIDAYTEDPPAAAEAAPAEAAPAPAAAN
jgi:hypothetical protein